MTGTDLGERIAQLELELKRQDSDLLESTERLRESPESVFCVSGQAFHEFTAQTEPKPSEAPAMVVGLRC